MRVALCYSCEPRDSHDPFQRAVPSGLLNVHGVLLQHGISSRLFNFSGVSPAETRGRISGYAPDLAGISWFTYNHSASAGLARLLRELRPAARIVAGGAQATHLDDLLLADRVGLDLVVRGEGESPFLEISKRWSLGNPEWKDIPFLTGRGGAGEPFRTPDAVLQEDLDSFYPQCRFEELEGVRPLEQFPVVITSRGCPADCRFCNSPGFWHRRVRHRSPARVAEEMSFLSERFGLRYFSVRDDTFTLHPGRVGEFCREKEAAVPLLRWNCQSRVTAVDRGRLRAMQAAGCDQIQLGVESAHTAVLGYLGKSATPGDIGEALDVCRSAGVKTSAYFITGVPGQTREHIRSNLALFTRHGLMDGVVSPLCYYPGTVLFEEAEREGAADRGIFLGGRPRDLLVRKDGQSLRQAEEMESMIRHFHSGNGWRLGEIQRLLDQTGRGAYALMDLLEFHASHGDPDSARRAEEELDGRFPGWRAKRPGKG